MRDLNPADLACAPVIVGSLFLGDVDIDHFATIFLSVQVLKYAKSDFADY
jgi:hypothetical protein